MTEERRKEIEAGRRRAQAAIIADYEAGNASDPWRQSYYDDTTQLLLALNEAEQERDQLRALERERAHQTDRLHALLDREETNLQAIWWGKPLLAWAAWKIEQLAPELAPACDPFSEREIAAAMAALVK